MNQSQEISEWRSTSFSILLSQPRYALDVYNALNKSAYDNPDDVEIIKVESGVSLSVKNDATFVLLNILNLYEHQSTPNPNMPLRFLIYVGKIYKQLSKPKNIYGSSQIYVPEPNFVVFYNGNREHAYPERSVLKLSDAYITKSEKVALELECTVLNINANYNSKLKEISEAIRGYSIYSQKVKESISIGLGTETAIRNSIKECIKENILSAFFKEYGEMIVSADVWDCTYEKQIEMEKRDSYAEGVEKGISRGITIGISQGISQGISRGISQGEERILKLINLLIKDGRYDDIEKVSKDPSYREKLFKEYTISEI